MEAVSLIATYGWRLMEQYQSARNWRWHHRGVKPKPSIRLTDIDHSAGHMSFPVGKRPAPDLALQLERARKYGPLPMTVPHTLLRSIGLMKIMKRFDGLYFLKT